MKKSLQIMRLRLFQHNKTNLSNTLEGNRAPVIRFLKTTHTIPQRLPPFFMISICYTTLLLTVKEF